MEDSYHIPQQSRRHRLRFADLQFQTLVYDQPCSLSCATHLHTTTTTTTNVTSSSPLLSCPTRTSNPLKTCDIPGLTSDVAGLSCASHTTTTNTFLLSSATHSHTTSLTSSPLLSCAPNTSNNRCFTPSPLLSCATHSTTTTVTPTSYRAPYTSDFSVRKPEQLGLSLSSLAGAFTGTGTASVEVVAYGGEEVDRRVDSVLRGSKFLKPVKLLLDEVCDVGFGDEFGGGGGCYFGLMMDPRLVGYSSSGTTDVVRVGKSKRFRLIELLNEVYKRYKHYYRQIQAVIASFDIATGAAPFAALDLKAMSKHFCYLNNAITDQLQATKEEYKGSYGQSVVNNIDHQPVWRPQRGLPKQAVTVLRAWLFNHFLHPYPTDTDKQMLATQTGLSRNQVSNWFINARVRLWKPMIEEVHTLETRQQPITSSHIQEKDVSSPKTSILSCTPKRAKNDYKHSDHLMAEKNIKEHINHYDSIPTYHSNVNRRVSLTLGLHQNNDATTLPLSTIGSRQRFVMGGLDAQNREIISCQFLQEFGGL